jgi:hypothetical protein
VFTVEGRMFFYFRKRSPTVFEKSVKMMIGYPIVFFTVYMPLTIVRFMEFSPHPAPFEVKMVAISLFVLNGAANALCYGISRNIFAKTKKQQHLQQVGDNSNDIDETRPLISGSL